MTARGPGMYHARSRARSIVDIQVVKFYMYMTAVMGERTGTDHSRV
jgi:hypothetical protein